MDKDKEGQPLVNYNFCLRVEGVHDLSCKSIHGFEDEYEYEYITSYSSSYTTSAQSSFATSFVTGSGCVYINGYGINLI